MSRAKVAVSLEEATLGRVAPEELAKVIEGLGEIIGD